MYKFKTEKRKDYLQGRTITYLSDVVGIRREYMTSILKGSRNCSKLVAYCISKAGNENNEVQDYFEFVKD